MKKRVLYTALALAGMGSAVANAATITPTSKTFSDEYLVVNSDGYLTDADFTWAPANAMVAGDKVVFTFTHAPVRSEGGAEGTIQFNFASSIENADQDEELRLTALTDTTVTYTAQTAISAAEVFTIAEGVDFKVSGVTAGGDADDNPAVSAEVQNALGLDRGDDAAAQALFEGIGPQYSLAFTNLGATTDVTADVPQSAFVNVTGDSDDDATYTATLSVAANPDLREAVDSLSLSITGGDFSWLDDDGDISEGIVTTGISVTAAGYTIDIDQDNIDDGSITIDATGGAFADGNTFVVEYAGAGELTIPKQEMTIAATGSAGATEVLSETVTDEYVSNGSTTVVYAVPTSAAVQNFIYLTNSGTSTGDVFATVYDNGQTYGPYLLGESEPDSEFDVGGRFVGTAFDQGAPLSGGRVRLEITAELPPGDVTVSASYKAISANDRVNLLTDAELNALD